jgi:benzoyl-CoA reductase/2-hydroxyglutaryl-CoA dehydratase subunit BcrC/BadD/HgdB
VLVRFRKNVLQKTYEEPEANYVINTIEEYDKNLEKIFSTGTKEQQVKGASKLAQRFMNDKEM